MKRSHNECPECKGHNVFYYPIEVAEVCDGDGLATYHTDDYWHCTDCNFYFDEEMERCEKPIQERLI